MLQAPFFSLSSWLTTYISRTSSSFAPDSRIRDKRQWFLQGSWTPRNKYKSTLGPCQPLGSILWAQAASEPPCGVTFGSGVQGNNAGSADQSTNVANQLSPPSQFSLFDKLATLAGQRATAADKSNDVLTTGFKLLPDLFPQLALWLFFLIFFINWCLIFLFIPKKCHNHERSSVKFSNH